MDVLGILLLESNKTRLLLHMHEVKGSAKLRGDSYFRRPSYHTYLTAKDHFRRVYYDVLNLIVSVIDKRFNQESFSSYSQMETLLVKTANGDDFESEFKFLEASFCQNVDTGTLPGQLSFMEAILKIPCLNDILSAVTKAPEPEKKLVLEVQTICWPLAVSPAINAAGERSFSPAQPLKTWLRSRMDDVRFSSLCLSRLSAIRAKAGECERKKIEGSLGKAPSRDPPLPNFPSLASLALARFSPY